MHSLYFGLYLLFYLLLTVVIHRCDNSDTEEEMPSDDSPMKAAEVVPEVMPSNGMITEDPSCEDIASKEDLEDGELEEGEIDDDEENAESKEVTEDVAETEQEQPPQQLEKIPPLLLNLKNIARQATEGELICFSWGGF